MFGFNHSDYVVKTDFFFKKKSSRTLILATCYIEMKINKEEIFLRAG